MTAPRQRRLSCTTTVAVLVEANHARIGLFLQNKTGVTFSITHEEDDAVSGIYLYPDQWIYLEEQDAPEDKWWVRTISGSNYITIIEFYKTKGKRDGYTW